MSEKSFDELIFGYKNLYVKSLEYKEQMKKISTVMKNIEKEITRQLKAQGKTSTSFSINDQDFEFVVNEKIQVKKI